MTVAMTAGGVRFAPRARWDRNFFLLIVALIWLGILMGFVPEIVGRIQAHKPAYPLIVPVHGAAFVGWLCLLTTQVLLIRAGRPDIHKRLGLVAAVLAPAMVVLGLGASWTMDRVHFGTPDSDPSFIAIQLADLINFSALAAAAIVWRKTPSAHKRLILLATIFIADAGFARWFGGAVHKLVGDGWLQTWMVLYVADFVMIALIGGYDLITRRRLHPAFVAGSLFGLSVQLIAVWLYVSPWWKPVATKLLGH
jgi:uncharacterized membrane protein YozB (DUF420 family)